MVSYASSSLGQQRKLKTKKMSAVPFDPEHPEPVAIFNYIYRPRGTYSWLSSLLTVFLFLTIHLAMLIAQGIIPPLKPPPEEAETARDLDEEELDPEFEDDPEDEDEIRYLLAEQERVRREVKELEDLRRLRVRNFVQILYIINSCSSCRNVKRA